MAIFNRKKADRNVLPEIEKYYDAEKRERAGMAWFLAIVSIAAVALLIIGLFFGGRWVYRKTTQSNEKTGVSVTENTKTGTRNTDTTTVGGNADSRAQTQTTPAQPTTSSTPAPAQNTPSVTPSTPKPATPTVVPATLANTGPASTLVIFIIATLGFAGLHSIVGRSRQI